MNNDKELKRYGVVGMKWGVRRAKKNLSSATTAESKKKAVAKLEKHRAKATKEVTKLNKRRVVLQDEADKHIQNTEIKAAKLQKKAAKATKKAYNGLFYSNDERQALLFKAERLNAKADNLIAKSKMNKAKIAENEMLIGRFNEGIDTIDRTLAESKRKNNKR